MKRGIVSIAIALMAAGSVYAQTEQRLPTLWPLSRSPQAQSSDLDMICLEVERAGYADATDLSRGDMGVWRGRARKGNEEVDVVIDKGGRIKAESR